MQYRSEIDGLRAVAVLPVILFHAGVGSVSGGFVGVDVFFVISGYLITSLILGELADGRFSFRRFYERRIRRLAPALILVILVSIPPAWALMTPQQFEDFAQSIVAVAVFASNVHFWIESGYFAAAAETKPLLHTWSLAVEEQFYLVFPALLLLLWRLARRGIVPVLTGLFALSFAAMLYLLEANPTGNYFLAPGRFWELLTGALCACIARPAPARPVAQVLSLAGLSMILVAVFAFGPQTPFPSVYALLPVMGTALVILFADETTWVQRALSLRTMVWIGLISYPAYLWHQPLFAFARLVVPEPPSLAVYIGLSALSLVLAHLTWRWIERPVRNPGTGWTRQPLRLWGSYVTASVLLVGFGLAGHFQAGFPSRMSPVQNEILTWLDYHRRADREPDPCFLGGDRSVDQLDPACHAPGTQILLVGDSHAQALAPGLWQSGLQIGEITSAACPPILSYRSAERPHCIGTNARMLEIVGELTPPVLLLHAHWSHYATPTLIEDFRRTLERIRAVSPETRIVVVGSIPKWYPSLPEVLAQRGTALGPELSLHLRTQALRRLDRAFAGAAATVDGTRFVSLIDGLCREEACLATVGTPDGPEPLVWDNAHLTANGARRVADTILLPDIAPLLAKAQDQVGPSD